MKVSEAMSRDVHIANPDQPICDIAKIMADRDVGVLPVGEDDRLVGMITDRDIAVRAVANKKSPNTAVREIMSAEILYCYEDEDLEDVADNMSIQKIRRMPVLNRDKRLVGIISIADLAMSEEPQTTGQTVADISEPGGHHSQTAH